LFAGLLQAIEQVFVGGIEQKTSELIKVGEYAHSPLREDQAKRRYDTYFYFHPSLCLPKVGSDWMLKSIEESLTNARSHPNLNMDEHGYQFSGHSLPKDE
jgi:hypothetical protein